MSVCKTEEDAGVVFLWKHWNFCILCCYNSCYITRSSYL